MRQTLGFIGLGHMGSVLAKNLLTDGHTLRVYNRTPSKATCLVNNGALLVDRAIDVCQSGGVVITVLSDDAALQEVATDEFAQALGRGGLHISISTVKPETSDLLAEQHRVHGACFVAAPIFGRPEAAAARKTYFAISGSPCGVERARSILSSLGQGVHDIGERPGAANVVKLAANFVAYAAVEAMAEGSVMVEKAGVPRGVLLEFLSKTILNCPIYSNFGGRIIRGDFSSGSFTTALGLKDTLLARHLTDAPLPLAQLLVDRYESAVSKGRSDADATILALGSAEAAGLDWQTPVRK